MHMASRNATKDSEEGIPSREVLGGLIGSWHQSECVPSLTAEAFKHILKSFGTPEHFKQAPRWHWSCWLVTTTQGPLCSNTGPHQHTGITRESSGKQANWIHVRKHGRPCSLDLSWEILVGEGVSGLGLDTVPHLSHPISLRHSTVNSSSILCLLPPLTSLLLHSKRSQRSCCPR